MSTFGYLCTVCFSLVVRICVVSPTEFYLKYAVKTRQMISPADFKIDFEKQRSELNIEAGLRYGKQRYVFCCFVFWGPGQESCNSICWVASVPVTELLYPFFSFLSFSMHSREFDKKWSESKDANVSYCSPVSILLWNETTPSHWTLVNDFQFIESTAHWIAVESRPFWSERCKGPCLCLRFGDFHQ